MLVLMLVTLDSLPDDGGPLIFSSLARRSSAMLASLRAWRLMYLSMPV